MITKITDAIKDFLKLEAASGILLMIATVIALVLANSPVSGLYGALLDTPVEIRIGKLHLAKPLLLWINDGLMAIFFFLIGLELKRELLEGELSDPKQIILPAVAAIGGMVVPAAIYVFLNWGDPVAIKGWAIPAATDIAFALGILALLGSRVPISLKVFLVSIAIIDDIGAILIIAIFYTSEISMISILVAAIMIVILFVMNRKGVTQIPPYIMIGIVLWIAVLKSGVHATLAGVALAFFIPMNAKNGRSPVRELEHNLHPSVSYAILPLFAFANAGVSLEGVSFSSLLQPVPLGIAAGLTLGKQLGIFLLCWTTVKLGLADLPEDVGWSALYGVSVLCGIGFTMSLFIGSLAFEMGGPDYAMDDRLGILAGSLVSAVTGYLFLKKVLGRSPTSVNV
jgi:NhaA family Na+:H+ antiporter